MRPILVSNFLILVVMLCLHSTVLEHFSDALDFCEIYVVVRVVDAC